MTLNKNHTQNDIDQTADMTEKERIAGVMASVMNNRIARYLGGLSDSELRDLTARMFDFMEGYDKALTDEQKSTKDSTAQQSSAGTREGELRRDFGGDDWTVCDAHTGKQIATLRQGMCLDICEDENSEEWVPVTAEAITCEMWYFAKDDGSGPWFDDSLPTLDDGLRVRLY